MAEKRPTPVKPLTIYFYHTRLTRESYEEWKDYKFPGHILYGLPLLEKYGIRSVMHKYKAFPSRLKLMLYATKEILCCKEPYEGALRYIFPWVGTYHPTQSIRPLPQAHCHLASHCFKNLIQKNKRTHLTFLL